jgi:hypothetical protein
MQANIVGGLGGERRVRMMPNAVDVDTNVVEIGFGILKNALNNLHQGDPVKCG